MESLEECAVRVEAGSPGYRRRIRVVPEPGQVLALLEDDIHAMAVRLRHDGSRILAVEPVMQRMPWNTCPGAAAVLVHTFLGVALSEVSVRKDRKANCTHLHDLAVIAAAHANDTDETCFDIAVSDPVDGERVLTLARNGRPEQRWVEQDGRIVSPGELTGTTLLTMRDAITALPLGQAEGARLLQWAGLVAHGRTLPLEDQSDATRMPANCYTFQPERARSARRVGDVIDFSQVRTVPGDGLARRFGLAAGQ